MSGSPRRPNVLFVLTDQQRPDFVGMHPDVPVRTPTLDRLAERGAWFENAVCPSPLCAPVRACLASGMAYDRCPVPTNDTDYPLAAPTLYRRLRDEAGYHVMGCGKFDLMKQSRAWGPDGTAYLDALGFSAGVNNAGKMAATKPGRGILDRDPEHEDFPDDPYMAYLHEEGLAATHIEDVDRRDSAATEPGVYGTFPTPLPEDAYCDNWIADNGIELLEATPADEPWFLQVNFVGPHFPRDVTEEMHGWYRNPDVAFPAPVDPDPAYDADEQQALRRNYAAMVENIDRRLGDVLDRLAERGELEETLVVFASDHGEMLGGHGALGKVSPRQPSVGVPLVVAGPGVEPRGRVSEPATLLDLHATVLDYAGLAPGEVDSRSMRAFLAGDGDHPRTVVRSGLGPWRLAFDGRYKLIRGYDPDRRAGDQVGALDDGSQADLARRLREREPVLFDLSADPGERRNVAPANPGVVERLDSRLPRPPVGAG
jgi:arylsulfatase A-like enzyme